MSLNAYNAQTQQSTTLAGSLRMWMGTKAAHDAAVNAGTMPNGVVVAITDDYPADETDDYSTNETKTFSKWIDGKPIYRKVVNIGTLPNNAYKRTNHGISNLDFVVALHGIAQASDGQKTSITLPWSDSSNVTSNISLYADNTNIVVSTGGNMTAYVKSYAIIEYTKTTD